MVSFPEKFDKSGRLVRKYCPEPADFPDKLESVPSAGAFEFRFFAARFLCSPKVYIRAASGPSERVAECRLHHWPVTRAGRESTLYPADEDMVIILPVSTGSACAMFQILNTLRKIGLAAAKGSSGRGATTNKTRPRNGQQREDSY